jgi:hypothetical protein
MFLKGLLNNPKHNASRNVDLPAPLSPTIRVEGDRVKSTSEKALPVERKFFHRSFSK